MYYNNSDRKLKEIYLENVKDISERDSQVKIDIFRDVFIKHVKPFLKNIDYITGMTKKYKMSLKKYSPDVLKLNSINYQAEVAAIDKVRNKLDDLKDEMKDLITKINKLDLRPDTLAEITSERKLVNSVIKSINDSVEAIEEVEISFKDVKSDF